MSVYKVPAGGASIAAIAAATGVSAAKIRNANPFTIKPGMKIVIPDGRDLTQAQANRSMGLTSDGFPIAFGQVDMAARGSKAGVAPTAAPAAAAAAAVAEAAGPSGPAPMSAQQQDAYSVLKSAFDTYGLGSLAPVILSYVQQSYGNDTISLLLQDTTEYKTRFAGNEARKKAGMPVLSPSEYLSTEASYRQIMSAAGLPKDFYDSPADFADWIGKDVAPAELNDRVGEYVKVAKYSDPEYRKMLQSEYGIALTDGDIAAFMIDQKRALPLLQKTVDAIGISESARRQDLTHSAERSMQLASQGVTDDLAFSEFGKIAEATRVETNAAASVGMTYSQADAENEILLNSSLASQKRKRIEDTFGAYNPKAVAGATKGAMSGESSASY